MYRRRPRSLIATIILLIIASGTAFFRHHSVRTSSTTNQTSASTAPERKSAEPPDATTSSAVRSSLDLAAVPSDEQSAVRSVAEAIDHDGPFKYSKDGTIFHNAGHPLPFHDRTYYREYTVPTPGAHDRGARRIIAGMNGELYYTNDHYRTFAKIR